MSGWKAPGPGSLKRIKDEKERLRSEEKKAHSAQAGELQRGNAVGSNSADRGYRAVGYHMHHARQVSIASWSYSKQKQTQTQTQRRAIIL